MNKKSKIMFSFTKGNEDKNLNFEDLRSILIMLGFSEHIRGDHHIFTKAELPEIINIQPVGNKTKPYQIKQIRKIIQKYHLEETK